MPWREVQGDLQAWAQLAKRSACRASISESLKAVAQQLHEAEAKNKHLVELECDLERREDIFASQVRQELYDAGSALLC